MLSATLGPVALPINLALLSIALLVAAGLGKLVGRPQKAGIGGTLTDMLLAGVLVARIVFVSQWLDIYRDAPWSMLDLRDGGFTPWAGLAAALLVAGWQGWRRMDLRKPLLLGLAAGSLVWGGALGALRLLDETTHPGIPTVTLTTLADAPVALSALAEGKPMVVNLWATWCPPCRREMPVLANAQHRQADIRFVFVNQGETAADVSQYLAAGQLDLANALLDPDTRLAREIGSQALPTTLFYDASGRLVDSHLGALSPATLAEKLNPLLRQNSISTKE